MRESNYCLQIVSRHCHAFLCFRTTSLITILPPLPPSNLILSLPLLSPTSPSSPTPLASSSLNSPSSFGWLRGYEGCRTGWDRFSKPRSHTVHGYSEGLPGEWAGGRGVGEGAEGERERGVLRKGETRM